MYIFIYTILGMDTTTVHGAYYGSKSANTVASNMTQTVGSH